MTEVSVLIPVYNCEDTLERSLSSVASQTFKDFEVLIVNNNCTDRSMEIVESFKSAMSIKVVECRQPGIVPALNTGLRHCSSPWIARQDGDDYWYPEKLEKQVSFLEKNKDVSILGTQIRLLDENGNVEEIGTFGKAVKYSTVNDQIKVGFLYGQNQICHPSVVFNRDVINTVGGYEKFFPLAEDLHLWMRCIPHFNFANLEEVLVDYTQKRSAEYDARVPMILADTYFNLYKKFGVVTGEREDLIMDWERKPGGHKHNVS